MEAQTRTCKTCGLIKPVNEFYQRRAVCKFCWNATQTSKNTKKNRLNYLNGMLDKIKEAHTIAFASDKKEDYEQVLMLLDEYKAEIIEEMNKEIHLAFRWPLSAIAKTFCKKCTELRYSGPTAIGIIYNKTYKTRYENIIGITQEALIAHEDEIKNFYYAKDSLELAYQFFIELYNNFLLKSNSSFNILKCKIAFEYCYSECAFVASGNPLNYREVEFLNQVDKETCDHWGFMNHHNFGLFKTLNQSYGVTQTCNESLCKLGYGTVTKK
jgi:hypothetical protein